MCSVCSELCVLMYVCLCVWCAFTMLIFDACTLWLTVLIVVVRSFVLACLFSYWLCAWELGGINARSTTTTTTTVTIITDISIVQLQFAFPHSVLNVRESFAQRLLLNRLTHDHHTHTHTHLCVYRITIRGVCVKKKYEKRERCGLGRWAGEVAGASAMPDKVRKMAYIIGLLAVSSVYWPIGGNTTNQPIPLNMYTCSCM